MDDDFDTPWWPLDDDTEPEEPDEDDTDDTDDADDAAGGVIAHCPDCNREFWWPDGHVCPGGPLGLLVLLVLLVALACAEPGDEFLCYARDGDVGEVGHD